ncbi:MAG: gluconate 2-dehydrogenase subunit 3 family protein, partial [Mucilaginibacter sp.]
GCKSGDHSGKPFVFFSLDEQSLITEVIDIILPATRTKSASAVGVHYFLDGVFAVCLTKDQQELIRKGLADLNAHWQNESDKTKFIIALDEQAYSGNVKSAWFKTVKQYTLIGFFTSEEGTTKAGDYQKIPEKFIGEVAVTPATLAHSVTNLRFS